MLSFWYSILVVSSVKRGKGFDVEIFMSIILGIIGTLAFAAGCSLMYVIFCELFKRL